MNLFFSFFFVLFIFRLYKHYITCILYVTYVFLLVFNRNSQASFPILFVFILFTSYNFMLVIFHIKEIFVIVITLFSQVQ